MRKLILAVSLALIASTAVSAENGGGGQGAHFMNTIHPIVNKVRDHRGPGGAPQGGVTVGGGIPCGYRCGGPGRRLGTVVRPAPQHGQYCRGAAVFLVGAALSGALSAMLLLSA
ncbi:MAG: hypothetical protein NVSMB26_29000 [Beijerinckiaceae bacterium]